MPTNFFKLGDWLYILPLAALGLFFGVIGFMSCGDCTAVTVAPGGGHASFVQAVARTLALIKASGSFPLDRNHWMLFLAQVIMPGLAFFGVLKLVLQNIRRDARVLWARRLRGHTIVCGLGSTGRQVVDSFSDAGRPVVVVALSADTPDAAACERRRIAVLEGNAGQAAAAEAGRAQTCPFGGGGLRLGRHQSGNRHAGARHPARADRPHCQDPARTAQRMAL